ncbi:MAG TPA: hypothetical protein PLR25_07845, partial [Planctomycetaceae bacterium]|nr:hypothetical protein [Planctomycetaceae bacterium]
MSRSSDGYPVGRNAAPFRIGRIHKASGQARTIVNGRHVYLGKFGSLESRQKYARILAEAALPAGTPDSPNRPKSR